MEAKVIDLSDSKEFQRLLGGKPETHGMKAGRVRLKAGESVGEHNTEAKEELIIFLSGSGEFITEGKSIPIGKGKITYVPPRTNHDVRNTGKKPLVYVYCVSPAAE